ncbi:hypothetical protein AB0B89_18395 [Sphaerisporangium sp. NPDC049002]
MSVVSVNGGAQSRHCLPALPALFRTARMARLLDGPDELHITTVARRVLR